MADSKKWIKLKPSTTNTLVDISLFFIACLFIWKSYRQENGTIATATNV
jgi:hypothetical protein